MKHLRFAHLIGTIVLISSGLSALAQDAKFSFKDTPGQCLDVLRDGKIVARYMYVYDNSNKKALGESYKPFLHVFDAEGKAPITKGPGGEFTHHRGIFIGWSKIACNGKTYDRWHMKGGEQIHRKFLAQEADASRATFTSLVEWNDEANKPIIVEERTMTLRAAPAPFYAIIDFESKLKAAAGDLVLDGDPEHAGIQFRPANEVDRKKTAFLFTATTVAAQPATNNLDLAWIAETIGLNDKLYSVVEMNHPGNPTGTKCSVTRDYGRFGYFPKTSIKSGESFTFKYRFAVAAGEMPAVETIQKLCNEFTGRSDPAPKTTTKASAAKGGAARPATKPK